jgi:uncharacterized protein YqeY
MDLKEKIDADIKAAMLARDKVRLETLRSIKSAFMIEATKEAGATVDDDLATKVIMKLHKQRKEAADIYEQQGREDLHKEEMDQAAILEEYLPKQLSPEELKARLTTIIAAVGASGPQDMGKVMGKASAELAGLSDGKTICNMVKEMLS